MPNVRKSSSLFSSSTIEAMSIIRFNSEDFVKFMMRNLIALKMEIKQWHGGRWIERRMKY